MEQMVSLILLIFGTVIQLYVCWKIIELIIEKLFRLNVDSELDYNFTPINKTKVFLVLLTSAAFIVNYALTHSTISNFLVSEIFALISIIGTFILPFVGYYWHVRNHSSPEIARRATLIMIPLCFITIFATIILIVFLYMVVNRNRHYYDDF